MADAAELLPLLDALAAAPSLAAWRGWRLRPVGGGSNNRLIRASGPAELAIKWAIRDERDRAGREFAALGLVRGLDLAPAPVLLERERYAQPVVVQSWLPGRPAAAPPAADAEWAALMAHYLAIHRLRPADAGAPLPAAVLTMRSPAEAVARAEEQLALVPPAGRSPALREIFAALRRQPWADWAPPPPAWCRNDPNPPNFIPAPGRWRSVDWEYSGWGDGAFEIADLLAHPAYAAVPAARRAWLIASYAAESGDAQAPERIRVYGAAMAVWWVARTARMLHGGDTRRLAALPADWLARAGDQHAAYLKRARAALA